MLRRGYFLVRILAGLHWTGGRCSRIAYEFSNCLYAARVRSTVSSREQEQHNVFPMAWRWIACRRGIGPRGAADRTAGRDGARQSSSAFRWHLSWWQRLSPPPLTVSPRKFETRRWLTAPRRPRLHRRPRRERAPRRPRRRVPQVRRPRRRALQVRRPRRRVPQVRRPRRRVPQVRRPRRRVLQVRRPRRRVLQVRRPRRRPAARRRPPRRRRHPARARRRRPALPRRRRPTSTATSSSRQIR
jgi:hypothetical protein